MGGGGLEPHIIDLKYYKLEGGVRVYENCTPTLTSRDYKDPLMVTQDVGINPTLTCNKNEGNRVAIPVLTPEREKKRQNGRRFKEDGEEAFTLTGQDRHGVAVGIDDLYAKREPRFYDEEAPTLRSDRYGLKAAVKVEPAETSCNQGIFVQVSEDLTVYAVWYPKKQCYIAIRKLTPKECFRLQGWTDDYFEKAEFVNSNSQLYKQAGNGVTVSVIEAIARNMV